MKNYSITNVLNEPRTELHDKLELTGAEISINNLPKGGSVPFVHSHKENEEIYFITNGKGYAIIDGEKIELKANDWLRISPKSKRQFFASENEGISFVCIQVKSNSLTGYTMTDAIVE